MNHNKLMMDNADSIAKNAVLNQTFDLEQFKAHYHGGASSSDVDFGFKFAKSCGDYAVQMITDSDNPREALDNAVKSFGKAILPLNSSQLAYALDNFTKTLAFNVHEFSSHTQEIPKLTEEINKTIAVTIYSLPQCDDEKSRILIKTLNEIDPCVLSKAPAVNDIMSAHYIAKLAILNNNFDIGRFQTVYHQGDNKEGVDFGFQFAKECADYTTQLISNSSKPRDVLEDAVQRLGRAILPLNTAEFSFGLDYFKTTLASKVPEFAVLQTEPELTTDVRRDISLAINYLPQCDGKKLETLIDVLYNFDKHYDKSALPRMKI